MAAPLTIDGPFPETLAGHAARIVLTADPHEKARLATQAAEAWRAGALPAHSGEALSLPLEPGRPARPELVPGGKVPKRGVGSQRGRIALLHSLAHIELNAINLAWDLIARFATVMAPNGEPRAFFDDWVEVGSEEAYHFGLLTERLAQFEAAYGDLSAHDGLWEAAASTAGDVLARLAICPLVLEARGLDVTPELIARLDATGDARSTAILQRIYDDEIGHVAIGFRWFEHTAQARGLPLKETWQTLVRTHFRGRLKEPFNDPARIEAGLLPEFYRPLSG